MLVSKQKCTPYIPDLNITFYVVGTATDVRGSMKWKVYEFIELYFIWNWNPLWEEGMSLIFRSSFSLHRNFNELNVIKYAFYRTSASTLMCNPFEILQIVFTIVIIIYEYLQAYQTYHHIGYIGIKCFTCACTGSHSVVYVLHFNLSGYGLHLLSSY